MGRVCKKIKRVLTKKELERLKVLIDKESKKNKNRENIYLFDNNIDNTQNADYYFQYIQAIKGYKSKKDTKIRNKLKKETNNWNFYLDEVLNRIKPEKYKFRRRDWEKFINRSEEYFKRYKSISEEFFSESKDCLSRAYLGFGFEFLLKGIFLKNGYAINKLDKKYLEKHKNFQKPSEPVKISNLSKKIMSEQTHELGHFIGLLLKVLPKKYSKLDKKYTDYCLLAGLKIAQQWRNLDVHMSNGNRMIDGEMQQLLANSYNNLYNLLLKGRKKPQVKF